MEEKYPEINTSSATEIQPFDTPEQVSDKERSRLRKIGGKIVASSLNIMPTTGALYGIAHTLDPTLPPHYSIGGSLLGGIVIDRGVDKLKSMKEKRKTKKNPPENPEIIKTDTPVV